MHRRTILVALSILVVILWLIFGRESDAVLESELAAGHVVISEGTTDEINGQTVGAGNVYHDVIGSSGAYSAGLYLANGEVLRVQKGYDVTIGGGLYTVTEIWCNRNEQCAISLNPIPGGTNE